MKKIILTQGKFALVDDESFEYLNRWKWYLAHGYAVRTENNYPFSPKQIRMHRVITNAPVGMEVDHVSGDKLDNRSTNLRICTRSQNGANQFVKKSNKSGYKGISWKQSHQRWCAQIRAQGKVLYLGLFDDIREAARVYNHAAIHHHGEFAVLNEGL